MRILFIGDVTGRAGREAVAKHLPKLKTHYKPDFIIVNGDNASGGRGINEKHCKDLYEMGADCITGGNHIWDQREVIAYIQRDKNLLRPMNYPENTPGRGFWEGQTPDGRKILVLHALGVLFMQDLDCPFQAIDKALKTKVMGSNIAAIFVDFHAEATSEKTSMGHYLDGRVSAVVGTHTHIPTADTWIMPGGTGYQTDAGMTGDYDSVIGVRKDIPVKKFTSKMPGEKFVTTNGPGTLCGTFIETNDANGKCVKIEAIRMGGHLPATHKL